MHPHLVAALARPLWLAPMAGVTDRAFRSLCLRCGAGLTYSEMVSAKGLHYGAGKTLELVEPAEDERRLAVQLFGSDARIMAEQAACLERRLGERLALVDVNMGCPVRKVTSHGEGAALMKAPDVAAEIIERMVEAVHVPVTAKFRSGWAHGEVSAPAFARRLARAGAALLAVHGRSAQAGYRGAADWNVVKQVKDAVDVPVAGSGDVFGYADAQRMMAQTGADAVMVARGARGNPWIFADMQPSPSERVDMACEHLALYVRFNGDAHLSPLRAQLSWYLHGQPGAAALRRLLSAAVTRADFEHVLSEARAALA